MEEKASRRKEKQRLAKALRRQSASQVAFSLCF
jgi:hypothetical protein